MNPRDLPDVVAELVSKMHAVILAPKAPKGGVGRLARSVRGSFKLLGEEILENSRAAVGVSTRGFGFFLCRLFDHNAQLRSHLGCLHTLENLLA